jgi:hypothetical protein
LSIIEFRNDLPIKEFVEKIVEKDQQQPVTVDDKIKIELPSFNDGTKLADKGNNKINVDNNINKEKEKENKKKRSEKVTKQLIDNKLFKDHSSDLFQLHPLIKESEYLYNPKVFLDPIGDCFEFIEDTTLKRGDLPFQPPVGWIRYGLKVKSIYKDIEKWLGNDGNPDEW